LIITIGWRFFYDRYTRGVYAGVINEKTVVRLASVTFMKLSDNGIEVLTQSTHARAKWSELHSVEKNSDYLFIYLTPLVARPLPLSVFKTKEDHDQFIRNITSHVKVTDVK
jgi:hypothetical protein